MILLCFFFILVTLKRAGEGSTLLCSLWCNLLLPGLASGIKSEVSGLVGWVLFGQNQPRLEKTKLKAKFSEYIYIFLIILCMSYERVSFWNRVLQHPAALLVKETPEYFQSWSSSSFTHAHNFVIILWLYLYLFWNLRSFLWELLFFFNNTIVERITCFVYLILVDVKEIWTRMKGCLYFQVHWLDKWWNNTCMEQQKCFIYVNCCIISQLTSEDSLILEMLR